jgi:hypothetical protein
MQLTPKLYAQAATLLVASSPQPRERRREPRAAARGVAVLIRPSDAAADGATVYVHDLSLGGAGLLTALRVPEGEHFVLDLGPRPSPTSGAARTGVSLFCTAAYCRDLAPGLFGVGAKFVKEVSAGGGEEAAVPEEFREFFNAKRRAGPAL